MDESLAQERQALQLDPLSNIINRNVGDVFVYQHKYDEGIAQYRKTLQVDPTFTSAMNNMAMAYAHKGMYAEAIAEFQKGAAAAPASGVVAAPSPVLAYIYAKSGRTAEARQMLTGILEGAKQRYVPANTIARIYAALGDKDKAFEWLEKGYIERSLTSQSGSMIVDPSFDHLRQDPRYIDLLRRINLKS
jgi:serine/threonine-protein kinase